MQTKNKYNSVFMDRLKIFKNNFQENIQGFHSLDKDYMLEIENITTELHSIYVRAAMLGKVSDEEINKRLEAKKIGLFETSENEDESK